MLVSKAMACAIVLALGCGLAEAQMQPRNGEITLKNGKTRAFKYIGNGYSDKDFQYAEEPDDLKPSFSDMTNLDLSGVAEIDFVEMTKKRALLLPRSLLYNPAGCRFGRPTFCCATAESLTAYFYRSSLGGRGVTAPYQATFLTLKS